MKFHYTSLSLLLLAGTLHAQEQIADVLNDPALKMSRASDRAKIVARIGAIENKRLAAAHSKARKKPDGTIEELVAFEGENPRYLTTMNVNAAISTGASCCNLHLIPSMARA